MKLKILRIFISFCLLLITCIIPDTYILAKHKINPEIEKLLKNPESMDSKRIRIIMLKIKDMDYQYQKKTVNALCLTGLENAEEALLEIIKGDYEISKQYVAGRYLKIIKDKYKATNLLKINDPGIQNRGLIALKGCEIDDELFELLKNLLQADVLNLRRNAVGVLRHSNKKKNLEKKVSMIVSSMKTVESSPNAEKMISVATIGRIYTDAGYTYGSFIMAISVLTKEDPDILDKYVSETEGIIRDCFIIVKVHQDMKLKKDKSKPRKRIGYKLIEINSSLKRELYRIIKKSRINFLRLQAVTQFLTIGTEEDLSFLKDIAKNDPFNIPPSTLTHRWKNELKGLAPEAPFYPVRDKAETVIKVIKGEPLPRPLFVE